MNQAFFFQRRFFPMWAAFSLGAFTDNMLKQALAIGVTYGLITLPFVQNSDSILPWIGALFPVAMLTFSTVSGQIADKYETSFMFRRTKLAEFFLMLLAGIGFLLGSGLLLVLTLFLMGAQSAFFSPVRTSAMPKYLHKDELVRGNAICNGALFISILLGLVIGGSLIGKEGGAIWVSLILVSAALAGWLIIRMAPESKPDDPDLKIDWNGFRQITKLVSYVKAEPPVIRPMLGYSLFFFISTAMTVAVPLYVKDTLGADNDVAAAMMAIFAIGALIGALVSASLAKQKSGLGAATTAMGIACFFSICIFILSYSFIVNKPEELQSLTFFQSPESWLLVGLFCLSSAAMGVYTVPLQAAIQRRVKPHHRARIMASANILNALTAGLGSLSVMLITETPLQPHYIFLGGAIIQLTILIYMAIRKRNVSEGLYDEMLATETETNS